jgi:hypothetical protein
VRIPVLRIHVKTYSRVTWEPSPPVVAPSEFPWPDDVPVEVADGEPAVSWAALDELSRDLIIPTGMPMASAMTARTVSDKTAERKTANGNRTDYGGSCCREFLARGPAGTSAGGSTCIAVACRNVGALAVVVEHKRARAGRAHPRAGGRQMGRVRRLGEKGLVCSRRAPARGKGRVARHQAEKMEEERRGSPTPREAWLPRGSRWGNSPGGT